MVLLLLLFDEKLIKFIIYFLIALQFFYFLIFLYKNFIRKRKDLLKRYGSNSWVLITGATDGIGRSYADELANTGFNIILVSCP